MKLYIQRAFQVFCLCLFFFASQAQVQPIIDNGYLSEQGWGGAIHPSGNFVVRADRSVIHAYDRKNHMLFQTYTAPCIAELIRFTADGKYMIIQTGGEIGDNCYRALVYDFYTGELLLNETGMHIHNAGPGNLFYLLKNIKSEELPEHKALDVYDLDKSVKPIKRLYDTIAVEYTSLVDKKTGDLWYNIYGHYTLDEIKAGKVKVQENFVSPEDKAWLDSLVAASPNAFDVKYYKEKSVSPVFDDADFRLIAGPYLLSGSNSGVYISRLDNNAEVALPDSVMIFGYNYLDDQQKLILKGKSGPLPAIALDLKTGAITRVATQGEFYHHAIYENDSTAYTVTVGRSYITINKYHVSNPQNPIMVKTIYHGLTLSSRDSYYTYTDRRNKLVLHSNALLIDLNDFSFDTFYTTYDTTLVHPAVVRFSPGDSSLLMINDWNWHFTEAKQFEKNDANYNLLKLTQAEKEKLVTGKPLADEHRRYFANTQKIFNYAIISNPYLVYDGFASTRMSANIEAPLHTLLVSPGNYFVSRYHDSLLVAEDDTNLFFAHIIKPKEIIAHEKAFDKFVRQYYNEKNLYRLNQRFPDYLFPYTGYDTPEYMYKKLCEPVKGHAADLYYQPFCAGKEVTTTNLQEAEKKFAASIVKPLLTYHPLSGKPVYCINLLNTQDIPDLSYAGISSHNDVYFHDVVMPLHNNRQIKLNYAMGIFEWQDASGKSITKSSLYENGEFIHVTPDGYYFASKNKLNRISIRLQDKVYPIEQFDLKYNRPDIILERLGCTDKSLLDSYHKAYLKRLKKMNFTEDMLKDDFHLPELYMENKSQLPNTTDSSQINLNLRIYDSRYTLDRINITINNVPVFGNAGINLRESATKEITKNIPVNLCAGRNEIAVSVLNSAGAESYRETVVINRVNKNNSQPNLYLVTIGDSQYKDERFNLSFAAKDAEDISKTFSENKKGVFGKVITYTLTNEEVHKTGIVSLKEKLKQARRDDVVMITVAGHGVLDKNFNYYIATYDMDFNAPEKSGLPYEELEALLDGIEPLKKTILIDACHSGEVDKEEVEQLAANNASTQGNIKFRAAGAGLVQKNLGLKSTSELMGELFTDLRKGTGATVISSAGGVEYAMESEEWSNGLFTYCLLNGLKNEAADINQDGEIWLSELQQYLRTQVTTLSQGKQQPTSRIENMSMDFRIW